MTFLLSEDEGFKTYLGGIVVSDEKNATRPVQVWFGQPDLEVRAQSYPYLTIDLVNVSMDRERAIHGVDSLPYKPDGITNWPGPNPTDAVVTESPIPVVLQYQVTSYARHPRHDRGIVAAMLTDKFPFQFGGFDCPDGTVRRAYLNRLTSRDGTDADKKRLFSKAFDVNVESEILAHRLLQVSQVTTVVPTYTVVVNDSLPIEP
jgi:hypothetical protein